MIKKVEFTKILIEGRPTLLEKMTQLIESKHDVIIEKKPDKSLIMVKSRDSVSQQPFYLGEMLVTECTVSINEVMGLGVLKGEEPEKSYQLAVVDAAWNAGELHLNEWLDEIEEEKEHIQQKYQIEFAQAKKTKVNFDTMEDYNDRG